MGFVLMCAVVLKFVVCCLCMWCMTACEWVCTLTSIHLLIVCACVCECVFSVSIFVCVVCVCVHVCT